MFNYVKENIRSENFTSKILEDENHVKILNEHETDISNEKKRNFINMN